MLAEVGLEVTRQKMTTPSLFRIVTELTRGNQRLQLVEDQHGIYHYRKLSADSGEILVSAPIHSDPIVLAEARQYFSDFLPFGGLPVDAT